MFERVAGADHLAVLSAADADPDDLAALALELGKPRTQLFATTGDLVKKHQHNLRFAVVQAVRGENLFRDDEVGEVVI